MNDLSVVLDARLTLDEFMNWVSMWNPESIIGQASNCNDCPIANYLNSMVDVDLPQENYRFLIGTNTVNALDKTKTYVFETTLPYWATQFIEKIDQVRAVESYVSAQECLDILKEIKNA